MICDVYLNLYANVCYRYSTQLLDSEVNGSDNIMSPGEWCSKWTICPNCNQPYDNDLGLALSAGYVQYIEEKEGLFDLKGFVLTESYMALLTGLRCADDSYFEDLEQVADKILKELLPNMVDNPICPQQRLLEVEADLRRMTLSYIARKKRDYAAAIKCEERARDLFQVLSSGAVELIYELSDYEGCCCCSIN